MCDILHTLLFGKIFFKLQSGHGEPNSGMSQNDSKALIKSPFKLRERFPFLLHFEMYKETEDENCIVEAGGGGRFSAEEANFTGSLGSRQHKELWILIIKH